MHFAKNLQVNKKMDNEKINNGHSKKYLRYMVNVVELPI